MMMTWKEAVTRTKEKTGGEEDHEEKRDGEKRAGAEAARGVGRSR